MTTSKRGTDHTVQRRGPWLVALAACLLLVSACTERGVSETVLAGQTMGTTYTVKLVGEITDARQLQAAIDARLVRVNAQMSTYDESSELSRFNRAPLNTPFDVAPELIAMIELSRRIGDDSDGAFDVTVGPLVNLWGFGPDGTVAQAPDDAAIADARSRVGDDAIAIAGDALSRTRDVYVDLSAVAKGHGVDEVAALLTARGYSDFLVEIGGELRASGRNGRGEPWRIAVEKPEVLQRSIYTTLPLVDLAMATSGDYRNYFEVDGQRFSHMIDPRSGRPITHNLASTTVLAADTATADGYATAISIMGPEAGLALAEEKDLMVLVIMKGEGGFTEQSSSALRAYLEQAAR